MDASDYINQNKAVWNSRVEDHANSEFYDVKSFLEGTNTLNSIELDLLGDLKNKKVLHLQCHFGLDTLSLSRLGADATGVDFSEKAIEKAETLSEQAGLNASFICADVYSLPDQLQQQFDMVFTSYGTIGWLPDMDQWAKVIQHFLKPGGQLILVEFHPVVWMFDSNFDKIVYPYHNKFPIVEELEGSYATEKEVKEKHTEIGWNHSLSEVMSALLQNGFRIDAFEEYDYSPYNCFNGMIEFEPNKYRIEKLEDKIPLVYALKATKVDQI